MAYEELKSSGISAKTPQNIVLGAGTLHKGLTFTDGKWNFEESLIGATSGGTKITIVPEFKDIEVDGALVKVKGLAVKIGETATMETNMVELTPDWIKMAIVGKDGVSDPLLTAVCLDSFLVADMGGYPKEGRHQVLGLLLALFICYIYLQLVKISISFLLQPPLFPFFALPGLSVCYIFGNPA